MKNHGDKGTPRVYKSTPTPPAPQLSMPEEELPAGHGTSGGHGGAGQGTPPPRAPYGSAKRPPAKKKGKGLTNKQMNILIGGLIALLVIVIVLIILLPGMLKKGGGQIEEVASSEIDASLAPNDDSYNPAVNSIDPTAFVGTVLPETEDAGKEYVEDTLFLGDSNVERMLGYREETNVSMKNGVGIVSMGVGDVPTLRCVSFKGQSKDSTMPEAVAIMQPMRVVMMFGTNNLGMNTEKFIELYKKSAKAVKDAYPYAELIIASILPVYKDHTYGANVSQSTIDNYNKALVTMAEQEGYKFLNWSEAMKDEKTGFAKTGYAIPDGVHISRAGATAMAQYFRTHAFKNEDTRPKPLKTIPQRNGTPTGLYGTDPSSFAPKSSSVVGNTVNVVYGVYDDAAKAAKGGKITIGGNSGASLTQQVAPGATAAAATATPDEGYKFSKWRVSVGTIADVTKSSVTFTVPSNAEAGSTIYMTAVFEKVATANISVVGAVLEEGTNAATGGTVALSAAQVAPGGQVTATATVAAGYSFVKWQVSGGTVSNPSSSNMTLTVPSDAAAGTSIVVTAVFRKNAVEQKAVPNIVGKTVADARAALSAVGLTLAGGTNDGYYVETQSPAAGTMVAPGSAVTVTAVEKRVVPDISAANSYDEAVGMLKGAGFTTFAQQVAQNDAPQGKPLSTNPGAGSLVPPGTTITIVVSSGPQESSSDGGASTESVSTPED